MNKLTLARPVRDLDEQDLDETELEALADGYPPSSLGGLDHEEVVRHLARRLLDTLEELDDVSANLSLTKAELADEVGR